jgi:phospholipase/carboxylesterase
MESAKVINKLIEDESKIVGAQRVFVGGFSQGCCIALHCGLEFP